MNSPTLIGVIITVLQARLVSGLVHPASTAISSGKFDEKKNFEIGQSVSAGVNLLPSKMISWVPVRLRGTEKFVSRPNP